MSRSFRFQGNPPALPGFFREHPKEHQSNTRKRNPEILRLLLGHVVPLLRHLAQGLLEGPKVNLPTPPRRRMEETGGYLSADVAMIFNGEPYETWLVGIHPHLNDVHQRVPNSNSHVNSG